MSINRDAWVDDVWTTLRTIPTGGLAEELEAAWRKHAELDQPVAVIFGAYDAGKSSLLKRILFEDGVQIPEWVTVSGRRETFAVDEVASQKWTFRDTPGLESGNEDHNLKALEGLDLADLIIWVLPLQLVTSNKEVFTSVVTGARFGVTPDSVSSSLTVVFARMDEAIDPTENINGFLDLQRRKRAEFEGLMKDMGAPLPHCGIHVVVADPYQGVGNNPPDADIYATGKGWDGVPEFRAALTDISLRKKELRSNSGYRFASRAVSLLLNAIVEEQKVYEEEANLCDAETERVKLWRASLEALRRKCGADLHRNVEEELMSAGRSGTVAATSTLQKRLENTIDRWSDGAFAEFSQLAASADHEANQRVISPSMERLKSVVTVLGQAELPVPNARGDDKVKKYAGRLGEAFRDGFEKFADAKMGMKTKLAAQHLREFEDSKLSWIEFYKLKKGKTFKSEELANKASGYVKWTEAINIFGPLVEQIGSLVYDVTRDVLSAQEADKKAQRRNELREELHKATSEIEAEAIKGFESLVSSFSEWLTKKEEVYSCLRSRLDLQSADLKGFEAELITLQKQSSMF